MGGSALARRAAFRAVCGLRNGSDPDHWRTRRRRLISTDLWRWVIAIAVFFDGLPPANTLAALAFNVAVIVAIQVNWPSAEILGS